MFEFCIVFESEGRLTTTWLNARSMREAGEKVEQATLLFQIDTNNAKIDSLKIIFDHSNFIRASRR